MKAYKGFDGNLRCRGFQYEVGKEYKTDKAEICMSGFHACEKPLDCFEYYPPGKSQYHKVDVYGKVVHDQGLIADSKVAARRIKIGAKIGIIDIVKKHIKQVMPKIRKADTGKGSAVRH